MMREIKFRAWTANTWVAEQWNIKMIYDYQDTTLTEVYGFNSEELPVMQFTGLKDKNDKDIYEGDILSTDLSRPYLVVEFRNGAFMFQCHDSGQDYYDYIMPPMDDKVEKYYWGEVIGNIYEHRHLLDK